MNMQSNVVSLHFGRSGRTPDDVIEQAIEARLKGTPFAWAMARAKAAGRGYRLRVGSTINRAIDAGVRAAEKAEKGCA